MTIRITDPALLKQIADSTSPVDLLNPDGELIATLWVQPDGKPPPGVVSPFSREEMKARRADKTPGRSLNEILADLQARG